MEQPASGDRDPGTLRLSRRGLLAAAAAAVSGSTGAPPEPLLSALDLRIPALAAVAGEVAQGRPDVARAAFAAHLRTRPDPRGTPPAVPLPTADDREVAERALRHEFRSVGVWHAFGPRIDWGANPTAAPGSPVPLTHEWTWQLNRHDAWAAMARVLAATGDPRYGRELAAQIAGWVRDNPPPAGHRDIAPGSRWRPIEAGIRMYGSWQQVFTVVLRHPDVFPDDALLAMVEAMRLHAEYLDRWHGSGNRICMEANGQFHAAVLFPEFRRSERWRRGALGRLRIELDRQVYPDGAQFELTPGYHALSLAMFVSSLRLARSAGYALPNGYAARLERMVDFFARLMQPDRTAPPFNDSPAVEVPPILAMGLELFPARADWRALIGRDLAAKAPAVTSCLFPWGGFAVMRSGWDRDAHYLAMDAGPLGYSHFHEDKLSFVISAFGKPLVVEAGSYQYDASDMRQYVRSARGHNVVFVDGDGQARASMPARWWVARRPMPIAWHTDAEIDCVCASYGRLPEEVWGDRKARGPVHVRQVLFVKPHYWVVCDTVTFRDSAMHEVEAVCHLPAPQITVDPGTLAARSGDPGGVTLLVAPARVAGLDVRVVQGQTVPVLQGWLPYGHAQTGAQPRPALIHRCRGRRVVRMASVFGPARAGTAYPVAHVSAEEPGEGTLWVSAARPDGSAQRIGIAVDGSLTYEPGRGQPARVFRAV